MQVSENLLWNICTIDGHSVSEWKFKYGTPPNRTSFFGSTNFNGQAAFMKMANPALHSNSELIINEIETLKALDHQNIIKPLHWGWHNFQTILDSTVNVPYIILPAYDYDLEDFVRAQKLLGWDQLALLVFDVFESIRHIHELGMVHGDICPTNILICDSTTATNNKLNTTLCDFGLSKKVGEIQYPCRAGKSYHTPPDAHLSFGFDLFSFGILLSRLCTTDDIWRWLISASGFSLTYHPWIPYNIQSEITGAIKIFTSHDSGIRESYSNEFSNLIKSWKRTSR